MSFFWKKPQILPPTAEPFFKWNQAEFTVGIAMFDQDHRALAERMSQIHEAITRTQDRQRAQSLLEQLIQETRDHFLREEAALKEGDFPDLAQHKGEHQELLEEVAELLRQFQTGNISGLALPAFLKRWLITHIKESDRRYGPCLKRKGFR